MTHGVNVLINVAPYFDSTPICPLLVQFVHRRYKVNMLFIEQGLVSFTVYIQTLASIVQSPFNSRCVWRVHRISPTFLNNDLLNSKTCSTSLMAKNWCLTMQSAFETPMVFTGTLVVKWVPCLYAGSAYVELTHLSPGQNGRFFADDLFRCIFVNEKFWILVKISLKFVPRGPIDTYQALVQITAWRRTGDG